jgi:hypothetical protein
MHPEGKEGVNIEKFKYKQMKQAILKVVNEHGPITFMAARILVHKELRIKVEGSVSWYFTT